VPSIAETETAVQPQAAEPDAPAESEPAAATAEEEVAPDNDKAARRRSTVREKVSFASQPEPAAPLAEASPAEVAPSPAPSEAPAEAATETPTQPRRAGWWSRRFGGGE
jgi:ribonuclease E